MDRASFRAWLAGTARHMWVILTGVVLAVVGLITLLTGVSVPVLSPFVLSLLGLVFLLIASYRAYRDLLASLSVEGIATSGLRAGQQEPRAPELIPDLMQTYFRGHSIRIADLAEADGAIHGRTFEDCVIHGPVVLAPQHNVSFSGCNFLVERPDDMLYEIQLPRYLVGPVPLFDCTFRRCQLFRVGIAAPAAFLTAVRDDTKRAPNGKAGPS
jgi:hypothetical protein